MHAKRRKKELQTITGRKSLITLGELLVSMYLHVVCSFFLFLKKKINKINKYSGSSPRFFCSSSDPPLISYICCGFHYSCQKILVPSGTEPPSIIPVSEHSSFQHFIARLSFSYP